MAEEQKSKGTLTMSRPNKLSLTKTVESGKVKQNFTHGRSKTVTVEVRKTRTFARRNAEGGAESGMEEVKQEAQRPLPPAIDLDQLHVRDKGSIRQVTIEGENQRGERARRDNTTVVGPNERQSQQKTDEETAASASAPSPAPRRPGEIIPPDLAGAAFQAETKKHGFKPAEDESKKEKKKIRLKGADDRRGSNKLTVAQALEYQEERMRSLASVRRQREKIRRSEQGFGDNKEKIIREVILPEMITVQELANRMAERVTDVVKVLMKMGTMATANQSIDADTAELVIDEMGHHTRRVTDADVENILIEEPEDAGNLITRAPVVTVMGHVDHGKTSLLDALRMTDVVAGEAGGITQHIGAYQVEANDQKVTFLDTPGHEAFTAMRARGAKVTDVVILVVAADDGIKAQTEEAISHAKSAGVPIVVAINKCDKPEADPQRVKNELMQYELVPEEFGGDVQCVEVSAKAKTGLKELVEAVLLQAEILELKANPARKAVGVVIEAKMDKGRGAVATLLVQRGTLQIGDLVVAGGSWGRIRAMTDDKGQVVENAIPSQPVEIIGLGEAPLAGDEFAVVESERTARDITDYRLKKMKDRESVVAAKSLDQLFAAAGGSKVKELLLIIKGDVQGSVEAIIGSISKFNGDEVSVKVIHSGVGGITESDVSLAMATGAIVVGFNVRANAAARQDAEREKIDIRYYSVIYDLVDDVKDALSGMLTPERREKIIGYAEIREVFNITKVGKVAGCYVTEGDVKRGAGVRLLRENVVIHEGKLKTLKRFKEEVKEAKSGYECGMAFENYDDMKEGDMIEAYEVEEIARRVEER